MERRAQDPPLLDEDRLVLPADQHIHSGSDPEDPWSANEHDLGGLGRPAWPLELGLIDEALALTTEPVSLHRDVEQAETRLTRGLDLLREQDETSAGAEEMPSPGVELTDRVVHPFERQESEKRRALSARHHEPSEAIQLPGTTYLDHLSYTGGFES